MFGKRAIITGGDSGIGRAVAIAFAREGADVLISGDEDAQETRRWIEDGGRNAVLMPGNIEHPKRCKAIVGPLTSTRSHQGGITSLKEGASIIDAASKNADNPNPTLKRAIQNFTAGLAQLLAANAVAPGPIWTPLTRRDRAQFWQERTNGPPVGPAKLATAYVMLADPLSSYMWGVPVQLPVASRSCRGSPAWIFSCRTKERRSRPD